MADTYPINGESQGKDMEMTRMAPVLHHVGLGFRVSTRAGRPKM